MYCTCVVACSLAGSMRSWHSQPTKIYFAQWQSLKIFNGVLFCLWETSSGDSYKASDTPTFTETPSVATIPRHTQKAGHLGIFKTLSHVRRRLLQNDVLDAANVSSSFLATIEIIISIQLTIADIQTHK